MKSLFEWLDTATFPVWQGLLVCGSILALIFIMDLIRLYRKYVVKRNKKCSKQYGKKLK
jgi:hypothetical protein